MRCRNPGFPESLSPERVNANTTLLWQIRLGKDGAALGGWVVVGRFNTPRDIPACRHSSMSTMNLVEQVLGRSSSIVAAPGGGASVPFASVWVCFAWVQCRISFARR